MPNIFDAVTANEVATYYENAASNLIPYLGATLFPAKKQLGLNLSWIKASQGLPVALTPAAFDTKAPIRDRIGFQKIDSEMPFFRESMRIGEKERQQLNIAQSSANADYIMPVINKIYDDQTNLISGAEVDNERMRMQLLSTGLIAISANGVAYNYDYKFKATHKEILLTAAMWSDTDNSNPIDDIRRWCDTVEDDSGVRPSRAVCTRKTWNYLLASKKIKLDMNAQNGQNIILTDTQLVQYLEAKVGVTVQVYNKKYALQDGSSHLFYPDDAFTLIPDGALGNTWFGTTPEESDLMSGGADGAQVSVVNTGVAVTTKKEAGPPVNVQTTVSEIALPSFETIDNIFIATVAAKAA